MRALLRLKPFRCLWAAQLVSSFGDAATWLALLVLTQRLTGSTAAVAGTAIAIALPQLVFGLLAGVLVDRWDRRRVLIASDLLRAGLVLGFLAVTTADRLWLLYALAFASSAAGTFFNPARNVFVAEVLPADRLLPANSLSETSRVVAGVAGVAAAGFLAGSSSLALVFVLDAASFLVSAVLVSRVRATAPATPERRHDDVWRELFDGLRPIVGSRLLLGVVLAGTIVMLGLGAVNVLLVPFVVDGLGASETWFGALEGAQVTAMVLAGLALATVGTRVRSTTLVSAGLVGVGAVVAALGAAASVWHLLPLLFAVGLFVTPAQASVTTILQTEVPSRLRGRAQASFSTLVGAAGLASMALAGLVAEAVGIRTVFLLSGLLAAGAGLAAAAAFRAARPRAAAPVLEPR
jgi:MFS family permease